jgi:hypothetical protein
MGRTVGKAAGRWLAGRWPAGRAVLVKLPCLGSLAWHEIYKVALDLANMQSGCANITSLVHFFGGGPLTQMLLEFHFGYDLLKK